MGKKNFNGQVGVTPPKPKFSIKNLSKVDPSPNIKNHKISKVWYAFCCDVILSCFSEHMFGFEWLGGCFVRKRPRSLSLWFLRLDHFLNELGVEGF